MLVLAFLSPPFAGLYRSSSLTPLLTQPCLSFSGCSLGSAWLCVRRLQCCTVAYLLSTYHYICFFVFLSEKYLRQISILGTNEWETRKNKGTSALSNFKSVTTRVSEFLNIFYFLVPEIEICLKYFLDKIFSLKPLCIASRRWPSAGGSRRAR